MLCNIIDAWDNPYKWAKLNAVIENTSHDNGIEASDHSEAPDCGGIVFECRYNISLNEAIIWAESQKFPVTLFLYDEGIGVG
ncbi:MAG: hypothetical protein V3U82_00615 [Robiginitomaculum sp.]